MEKTKEEILAEVMLHVSTYPSTRQALIAMEQYASQQTTALQERIKEMESYKANFLWGFPDESIEALGYEFANAKTEAYQKEIWDGLVSKIKELDGEWVSVETPPTVGEEYNVVWDLEDGGNPVVTTMEWDAINKRWEDAKGDPKAEQKVLFWRPLPPAPGK